MIKSNNQGGITVEIKNMLTEFFNNEETILLAILYGSFAAGRETNRSDVDIAIAGHSLFHPEQIMELNLKLSKLLEREVDLIDLNNAGGTILTQILTTGTLIKKQDTNLYASLIKKMLYFEEDMAANIRYILKYRQENFLNAI